MNVIQFPHAQAPIQPIGHFIRLGESGYQKLGSLHAAGRLPANRVVADASRIKHQPELIGALKATGCEIILDTKAAELSAREKFNGMARYAPWSALGNGSPLNPTHFAPSSANDLFGQIARFAIEYQVDTVLAPTHFLGDPEIEDWFAVDRSSCIALRKALDREGGQHIAIDYPVILPHTQLNDDEVRSDLMRGLTDLPFDNIWIRASGFGSDAAPLATTRFISAMNSFHNLGKPIVADYVGGLVGLAALAFGAISGMSHGIGERERFDARSWHKTPKEREEGEQRGRAVRTYVPGLDRSATLNELELMVKARGGRRLVACCDRGCCVNGFDDMKNDPRQHAAYQAFSAVEELAKIPDLSRSKHFLDGKMRNVDQQSRAIKDLKFSAEDAKALKIDAEQLTKRLVENSKKIGKMRSTLEHLHELRADGAPRARPLARRVIGRTQTAFVKK